MEKKQVTNRQTIGIGVNVGLFIIVMVSLAAAAERCGKFLGLSVSFA